MSEDNGGAAFPWCGDLNDCPCINLGMTLRDYFAAKAMHIAYQHWPDGHPDGFGALATFAYRYADAMLEARK